MTKRAICMVALVILGLAGCASPAETPTASAPSLTPSPSLSLPARGPDDKPRDPAWVVGTVTAGGSGPCYGLRTDDGTQYALYSPQGTPLVQGDRVRVRTERAHVRIYCGPGQLVEMTAAEPAQ